MNLLYLSFLFQIHYQARPHETNRSSHFFIQILLLLKNEIDSNFIVIKQVLSVC